MSTQAEGGRLYLPDAARALGISAKTLRREIKRRQISYQIEGARRYVFTHSFLDDYRRRRTFLAQVA